MQQFVLELHLKYFSMQEEKYAKQAGAEVCQAYDKLGLAKSALPS
jgi:hypothetical protein